MVESESVGKVLFQEGEQFRSEAGIEITNGNGSQSRAAAFMEMNHLGVGSWVLFIGNGKVVVFLLLEVAFECCRCSWEIGGENFNSKGSTPHVLEGIGFVARGNEALLNTEWRWIQNAG